MARSLQPYNWLIIVGVFALLFGGATALQATSPSEKNQPDIVADQVFETIDGAKIALHDFKGKIILIHFWASWCPPCVTELPLLLQAAKDNPDIAVIAVSIDRSRTEMTNFLAHIKNLSSVKNVYFVQDAQSVITVDGQKVYRYPETFVIAPDLTIRDHIRGGLDWRGYDF